MNVAATIGRILLGILFTFAGAMQFVITNPPPQPGLAGILNDAFAHSHWAMFVGVAQIVIGVLFLIDRYVPLALIMLAAFLYNSFAFHLTVMPIGLPAPLIVTLLAIPVALKHRRAFAPLFHGPESKTLRSDAYP
jgi:putative oxidoreductase